MAAPLVNVNNSKFHTGDAVLCNLLRLVKPVGSTLVISWESVE